ncbi:MAG: 23S rRNA (pseudouridine(1915)-N(3))-methyltransferase RlmH [Erysipelothrix sp.]|nr:23S rRNA (pseudouridine(1915)-N(3))-methyltransferase RlmH [Erysipelothrix sp.]
MIKLLCVGAMKDKAMTSLQDDYMSRINRFMKLELIEVKEASSKNSNIVSIQREETENLMKRISDSDFVVLLDLKGDMIDSVILSKRIEQWSAREMVFVIGGSWGVSVDIQKRADFTLKLSALTLPHLLARVVLLEQIYRSFKIIHNQEYHK